MGKARDYIPALKYGHKIYPEDLAGMIGLPSVGDIFYVDSGNGSDSNGGKTQHGALKTVGAAYALTTSGHNDVVLVSPTGTGSGRTSETANITWSKHRTHLIGNGAPLVSSTRSGMSMDTDAVSPSFTISGNGCIFKNLTIMTQQATNYILATISGDYNLFSNVHFAGIGHTTAGDSATSRDVLLSDCSESVFVNCNFGLDTVLRSAANGNLEFASASAKNTLINPFFTAYNDATTPYFVIDTATGGQRWNYLENAFFFNYVTTGYGSTMAAAIHSWAGSGQYVYRDPVKVGCTAWVDGSAAYHWFLGITSDDAYDAYSAGIGYAVNPD